MDESDYFQSRREFEDLRGRVDTELRERLAIAEAVVDTVKNLNGSADPTIIDIVRTDIASINAELQRRADTANPRAAQARAAFGPYRLTEVGNGQRFRR